MNRHLHRIVFNAARGMRMVVQETATSTGKGASKATTSTAGGHAFIGIALAGVLAGASVHAQIVGAPNVPGSLRPTVLVAPNGVPLINIQTPSAAGVSRNVYNQFNVGPNGAIFNNSRTNVQTQLGGIVQGNPFLARGPARIILNEVNGGNVSQLRGYMEVAGQRAEIIIANPAGINVDGAGFINASRATLTTGVPQMNAFGGLDSFLVRGGTITINGAGLDASKTDYAAILARAVEANAGIWASELKVVTGANQVSADHNQISATTGTGAAPTFALDVAALGGMYAGKIVLIGTEAGLGVRNAGTIQAAPGTPALAGAGQLVVTTAGRLENIGTIQATADAKLAATSLANSGRISSGGNLKVATQDTLGNSLNGVGGTLEGARVELASAAGNIDNRNGGTIRQTSSAALEISAPALSNTGGGVIGLEPVALTPSQPDGGTGTGTGGGTTTPGTPVAGSGSGTTGTIAPAPYVPPSPGTITAAHAILNDGGRIYAGGPITLQSANISNNGGTMSLASMTVKQPTFDNRGGTLNISNGFNANVDRFDNSGGKLNAGSLNIATSGDLINADGTLTSASDTSLTVGGKADNTRGAISATGALNASVAGATNNTGGTLASNQGLMLSTGSLDNTKGSIQSAQAGVQLAVSNQLVNGNGGTIDAATDLNVQAGSLANGGSLRGANDVTVAVGGVLTNDGSITAGRNTMVGAGTMASGNASVLGAGVQSDGKLGAAGDLRVTTSGALVANGNNIAAGNATLQGASVDLSGSQTSAAHVAITATQGNVTTSKATVVTPGTLSVTAHAQPNQTLVNEGGKLNANQLDLKVSNIANTQGGEIVQTGTGATRITTSGVIDNSGGTLASNGSLAFTAASLNNKGGTLRAAQTSDLTVTVAGLVDNRQGEMSAGGNTTLQAGSLDNDAGRITAVGDASSTTSGTTRNKGGTIAANGNTTLNAGSLDNAGGTVSALNTLTAKVQGAVDNTAGTLVANQTLVLDAGSLVNDKGAVQSTQAATRLNVSAALNNGSGFAGAATDLGIKAGSLANAGNLRGGNDASVAVGGQLANDGNITAGRNTAIKAGSVQSSSEGVLGAGIQSDGKLGTTGDLSVTADGALVARGTNLAAGNVTLQGASVDVSASQTSAANIAVTATQGDVITSKATVVTPGTLSVTANSNAAQTLVNDAGKLNAKQFDLKLSNLANTNGGEIVQTGTGATAIAMSGTLNNDGGRIASNGNLALDAASLSNRSGSVQTTAGADLSLTARALANNSGGDILSGRNLSLQAGALNNDTGRVTAAGDISSVIKGAASNRGGTIAANGNTVLNAGSLDNSAGTVSGVNRVNMAVAGALDNSAGTLVANQALVLDAGSLDNAKGVVQSLQSTARLGVAEALKNSQGQIGAATDLDVKAGSVANSGNLRGANDTTMVVGGQLANDGNITAGRNTTITAGSLNSSSAGVLGAGIQGDGKFASAGDLHVTTTGAQAANGNNIAAGNAAFQGASVDLAGSKTSAANIAVTATQGNVTTNKAMVVTPGILSVTANSNAAQTLVNDAGKLNAKQLDLKLSNLANTNGGEIVQFGAGSTVIAMSGTLSNDGGRIASNGQDLTLQAATIGNADGKIEHAGTGVLNIAGGSYSGINGQVTTNGALVVAMKGAVNQDGGATSAKQITVDAGSLSNRGGQIVQTGAAATRITVVGAADNTSGTIAGNGNMNVAAGSLINQGGIVRAAGTSNLDVSADGLLDNSKKGDISAGGNTTLTVKNKTGSLDNDTGSITAAGDLNASIAGDATNKGGILAAKGNTALRANTLDNSKGTVAAVAGHLQVTTAGATVNTRGGMQAAGATTLINGGLVNDGGKVIGNTLAIDAGDKALNNDHGILDSATTLDIRSGALDNNAGLIQSKDAASIDTHGQKLTNTRSPAPEQKQGVIVSGGALTLRTGAVDNTGGYIGSKGALDGRTDKFTNTAGTVIAQANAAIDTRGADYDNGGGQTMAVGDLGLNAGNLNNAGGLIRSMATTSLNASSIANNNTLGKDQGIEGKNVVIAAGSLNNTSGAIRADVNAAVTSGGKVDNTSGLISAGDTLSILDPNAGSPGAKTLNLVNTNGTLVADKHVRMDAGTFSGDGRIVSGKDLSIALKQDIVNNGEVAANGNLTYTTTGNFTNNGKLLAGQTLTVGGHNVDNTANAEMSGGNTTVNASGTLTNRGLIDSNGNTQINTGATRNIGTGRIYGDQLSVATGTLDNDAEGAKSGAIAARNTLNIGAGTINNREHSLIFSGGTGADAMNIGGALDANRKAIGQGGVLNNLSADIESLGGMTIGMTNVNNRDVHIERGNPEVVVSSLVRYAPQTPVNGRGGFYALEQVRLDPVNGRMFLKNPNGTEELIGIGGYGQWASPVVATNDTAKNLDPARMAAAGDITVSGRLLNQDSQISAGGTVTAGPYVSEQMQGQSTLTVGPTLVVDEKGGVKPLVPATAQKSTISLGAYKYEPHLNTVNGRSLGAAPSANVGTNASGTGGVGAGTGPATIVEVPANVGAVVSVPGKSTGTADASNAPQGVVAGQAVGAGTVTVTAGVVARSEAAPSGVPTLQAGQADATRVSTGASSTTATTTAQAGATRTIPMVVRTSSPNINIPRASLFNIRSEAGSRYLIETDPRFANYRNWLSSDYLLNNLGHDPSNTLKRLGDGFYEQKLVREQVAQLTGYRFLDGFGNDDDQYIALMNAGATFAKQYGLRPGIGLSAAQMAQLTSDIVWLVEQTVTLPDGSTQRALVPQVYVRVRPGDIDGSGALLSADATVIKSSGDLVNTGTIAGRSLVKIDAENVNNLAGRIAGGSVGINARNDLNNIGGSITARDAAVLTAGRDINIQTTTQAGTSRTDIDRVAGVYVTNPGGVLIASAGRDVNLIAAALVSAGSAAVGAGRSINLGTVTEDRSSVVAGKGIAGVAFESREVGSVIQGQDNVRLAAGNDLNIRAGAVASVEGALVATARNDINVTAGQATTSIATATQSSSNSLFKKSSSSTFDSTSTTDVLSSSLSGKNVALVAGSDINLQAAQLRSDEAMSLSAGRDINLTTADRTTQEQHARQSRTSASGLGNAIGMSMGPDTPNGAAMRGGKSATSANASTRTDAIGTTISAGSLQTVSGRDTTLQGATVVADKDITMLAGRNLTIESAQNTRVESSYDASSKSGMVGKWYNPAIGHIKGSQANATASTTQQASQVASLQGNVTLVAGNEYRQTASSVLAAGQAGPLAGGDVNILAKNVVINEAFNTTQSVTMDKSSSTIVGGSASFMGVSTDTIKGASSTIKAMGETKDGRAQALGAINLAMSGKQVYDAASKLGSGGGLSYGVSVNVSRNSSQSTSFTNSSEAVGSGIVGANNVNIAATGGGKGSNIRAVGSTVAAGNTVNLAADNNVSLEASKNTSLTAGRNSSRGANVGVTFGGGAQNGFSIQLGVNQGKGRDNQNDIGYNATQVSGGKAVNISSGGDLNMRGGIVEANRVTADVGGNLNIETLQDVSVGQSRQSSSGLNMSLCIPPICAGISTVGGSAAGAKADGVFVSPKVQSGIKAGDGGFDVKVAGNTNLKGAVIESTQAAIDNKKNSFNTGGTLTTSDLQNLSQSSGSSYSVSGSVGFFAGDEATHRQALRERGMSETDIENLRRPSGGAGEGTYTGDNQSSVTKSGISGVAGDQGVRTGDNSSAGTLVKDWNTKAIVKDVQAQAQISQEFKQKAAKAVGDYADGKLNDAKKLRADAQNETDLDKKAALIAQANDLDANWKEGGVYRVLAHTAVGGLSGGVAGAVGSGVSARLMPRIGDAIADMGLPSPVTQAVGAATAAAIGGIVGGTSGATSAFSIDINNRQLHFTETQKLAALQANKTQQEQHQLKAAACFLVKCADGIPQSDPKYGELRSLQDEGKKYEKEQDALRATGEFVYAPYVDAARDALTRNGELIHRTGGAADLAGGSVGLVGGGAIAVVGVASCVETLGLGCAAVPLGAYIANASNAQAQDGSKTLFGPYQSSEGQRVLDSFSVAGYPGERDPLKEVGIDASKFGLAWLGGKYIPKAIAAAEGLSPSKLNVSPNVTRVDNNANRDADLVKTPPSPREVKELIDEHSKSNKLPLSSDGAKAILEQVTPMGTTARVAGDNVAGPDIRIVNSATFDPVTTVQVKAVSNARNFEAQVLEDLKKPIAPDGGSQFIAVQVPYGSNVSQLQGKLGNFSFERVGGRSIVVVDEFGNVLIPLQLLSNFVKKP